MSASVRRSTRSGRDASSRCCSQHGEISDEPPDWLAQKMLQEADAYLIVGNDLVLPLADVGSLGEEFVAKTCLDRGGISEPARKARNERARRRARRGDAR